MTLYRERCRNVTWELDSLQLFETWSLWNLGDLHALTRRLGDYLREADERGDLYASTTQRLSYNNSMWLVRDRPEVARREVDEAMRRWDLEDARITAHAGLKLQHRYALYAHASIDLYEGNGAGARRRVDELWQPMKRALLLRPQQGRISTRELRARGALAAAFVTHGSERARLRTLALRDVEAIERERAPWGDALAALARAAITSLDGDAAAAAAALDFAARALDAVDMPLHAGAARWRLGRLVGGDVGRAAVAEVEADLRARSVVAPARLVALLSPGPPIT
jgi:hypothetical protein